MTDLIKYIQEIHRQAKAELRKNFTEEQIEEMEKQTGFTKNINAQIAKLNEIKDGNTNSN